MGMRDRGGCTKVSPLSLVMLGGRPAGSACSKTAVSPARAELYMRVAKAITSGDSGVGWIVWSPGGGLAIVTIVRIFLKWHTEIDFGVCRPYIFGSCTSRD